MFNLQDGQSRLGLSVMLLAAGAAVPTLVQAAGSEDIKPDQADKSTRKAATETGTAKADAASGTAAVTRMGGVQVTRKRTQSGAAVATKQTQDRVMDVLTKEQIETLPDATVTDTVKRVAGVSVSFNSDNVSGRDEAQYISIRGLDASYNNVSIEIGRAHV